MLERMAIQIAELHYKVSQHVEGKLYKPQIDYIAELLESYKNHTRIPEISDYKGISKRIGDVHTKRHESDYYLIDEENNAHYLIELKIGGDLDNKKARSEKESLLEQYCILTNELRSEDKVNILFATAYNRYGEGKPWTQGRVRQFFANEELYISKDFWNFVCKSDDGYCIVIDEYRKNAHFIAKRGRKSNKNTQFDRLNGRFRGRFHAHGKTSKQLLLCRTATSFVRHSRKQLATAWSSQL